MTTATITLTDFLLARIAEDEAMARTISAHGRWDWREFPAGTLSLGDDNVWAPYFAIDVSKGVVFPTASVIGHIARWDPTRVLAECDAKRRIVETEIGQRLGSPSGYVNREVYERIRARADSDILRALALPYADHRDYREEWRP